MKAVKVDEPRANQTKVDIDEGFSIRDALNILFCHKWKILLFFLTVSSVVAIITFRTPFVYSSSASLLIGVGRERIDIAPVLKPTQYLNQGQEQRVNNEMVVLKSRYLAARTADKIGLSHFFQLFKKKSIDGFPLKTSLNDVSQSPSKPETPQATHQPTQQADNSQPKADEPQTSSSTTEPEEKQAEEQQTAEQIEQAKKAENLKKLKKKLKCQIFTQLPDKDKLKLQDSINALKQLPEQEQQNFWDACNAAMNIIVYGLSIDAKPKSFIINLSYSTRHPLLAQLVLEETITSYIERYLELRTPKASVDVFKSRFEEAKRNLEKSEQAFYDFRRANNIAELNSQKTMLISRIGELIGGISSTKKEVVALEQKIKKLRTTLAKYDKEIEIQRIEGRSYQVADALKSTLFKLQGEESEITSLYPDDSRKVKEIRARIKKIEQTLASQPKEIVEVTRGVNHQYNAHEMNLDTAEVEYVAVKSKLAVLQSELEDRQTELNALSSFELQMIQLERQVEMDTKIFRDELEILKRADSYQALDDSKVVSIDVVETPSYNSDPTKPNKPLNIILGIIFGLLGGLGIAFIIDYFDDSMKTNEDVKRRIQLPVLAMISSGEFYKCI